MQTTGKNIMQKVSTNWYSADQQWLYLCWSANFSVIHTHTHTHKKRKEKERKKE